MRPLLSEVLERALILLLRLLQRVARALNRVLYAA